MATVNYVANESWQEVTEVGTSADFILQNINTAVAALVAFGATAPAAGTEGHFVEPGGSFIRAGADGKLWVKSADDREARLVISAGV